MSMALTGWMLYTMLAVLALIGLNMLVDVIKSLASGSFNVSTLSDWLSAILQQVFPLMLVANLISLDPTGIVLMIGYYVGGVGVVLQNLLSLKNKLM